MTTDREKAKAIFLDAVENFPPDQWPAYLDRVCRDDAELRRWVNELLTAHQGQDSLLDRDDAGRRPTGPTVDVSPPAEAPGTVIGPYKLLQQIGEGGMGVVYMAQQTEPVERRVALKIIKPGMDTRQVIARFEAERRALAMMDHPNIAKVLDAGTTGTPLSPRARGAGGEGVVTCGRPYFVMELVKGVPITEYCDQRHLSPRQRLELFVPVCQAVQHAHQKGIIHRDIKPSNVMVCLYDGRPVPKVIDFGVAKAIRQRLTEKTLFTQFGQIVGTLEYMSPEQAELSQLDVDTRSDIYSLGVLLYELLTGETPFDRERLRAAAFDEMLRIIREDDPPRPSHRLSSSDSLPSIAANRQTEPKKLTALVRGELDWIVLKTLEKDRNRRYETADALAEDVRHYLADEPVHACPPSASYRFRKFARRNKATLFLTGLAAAALIVVAVSLIVGYRGRVDALQAQLDYELAEAGRLQERARRLTEEQARLNAERAREEARLDALVEEGLRLASRQAPQMARAVENFTAVLVERPDDANVHLYRGSAHYRLNRLQQAHTDLNRALELQPENNLAAHQLLAIVTQRLGQTEESQIHLEEVQKAAPESVEALTVQALALNDRQGLELLSRAIDLDPFQPELYLYRGEMAHAVTFREGPTEKTTRQAVSDLELALKAYPRDPRVLRKLLFFLTYHGQHVEGAGDRREALLDQWLSWAPNDPAPKRYLMLHFRSIGDMAQAMEIGEKAHREHPDDRRIANHLAEIYVHTKQFAQAIAIFDNMLRITPDHPVRLARRADCHIQLGATEAARKDLLHAVESSEHTDWDAIAWASVISGFRKLDDLQTVEELLRRRILVRREELGEASPGTLNAIYELAEFLQEQNRPAEAEEAFREAFDLSREALGDDDPLTVKCIQNLMGVVADKHMHAGYRAQPINLAGSYSLRAAAQAKLGDFDRSAIDYDRCLDLLPAQSYHAYPVRRQFYWQAMQWDEVYQRLAESRADDEDLSFEHGLFLAARGEFDDALDEFRQREIPDSQPRRRFHAAMLLLLNDEQAAFQTLCRELAAAEAAEDFRNRPKFDLLGLVVTAGPESGIDRETLHTIAERIWEKGNSNPHKSRLAGACSLRAGQPEEARVRLMHSLELTDDDKARKTAYFWLAMVHHHLGNGDESRQWYGKGVQALQAALPPDPIQPTSMFPYFWLQWNVQFREASALLGLDPEEELRKAKTRNEAAEAPAAANEEKQSEE